MLAIISFISGNVLSIISNNKIANIEKRIKLKSTVEYQEAVYDLYKNSKDNYQIYSCTSSWLVSKNVYNTLIKIKASKIYFLGPIINDQQLFGAIFRKWIALKRIENGLCDFSILHQQEQLIKMVIVGESTIISSSDWATTSKEGFLYKNNDITKSFLSLIDKYKENSIDFEEIIFNKLGGNNISRIKLSDFSTELYKSQNKQHQDNLPYYEFEKTILIILKELEEKNKVSLIYEKEDVYVTSFPDINKIKNIFSNPDILPAIRIATSSKCNFKCNYCPNCNENFPACYNEKISISDFNWITKQLIESNFSVFRLTGGEPLLLENDYLRAFNRLFNDNRSVEFKLATNGYFLIDKLPYLSPAPENFTFKVNHFIENKRNLYLKF